MHLVPEKNTPGLFAFDVTDVRILRKLYVIYQAPERSV